MQCYRAGNERAGLAVACMHMPQAADLACRAFHSITYGHMRPLLQGPPAQSRSKCVCVWLITVYVLVACAQTGACCPKRLKACACLTSGWPEKQCMCAACMALWERVHAEEAGCCINACCLDGCSAAMRRQCRVRVGALAQLAHTAEKWAKQQLDGEHLASRTPLASA